MLCKDAFELVEALVAGDLQMDDVARGHFETCPRCAGALASARRLETLLRAVDVPPAPSNFTTGVLHRIRRDRWRSEQHVDRLFNLAIAVAVLLLVVGIAGMFNVEGVFSMSVAAWGLAKEGARAMIKEAVPALTTYVAAAGLLASAVVMWWWAERRWLF